VKEADVVAKIHDELRQQLPRAVYLKLNDMSTTGIPDLALTYGGKTTFVEVKTLRAGETASRFRKHFSGLQLATCRLLEQQGRCQYFISYENDAIIVRPHRLAFAIEHGAEKYHDLVEVAQPLEKAIDHLIWMVRQP
jgi:hypothetical protein